MILRKTILEGTHAVHLGVRLCLPFAKGAYAALGTSGPGTNDSLIRK